MRRIKAALLEAPGAPLRIVDDIVLADPKPGEALVRITHCGLCHSDLSIIDGHMPYPMPCVLGHEAAGEIIAFGGNSGAFSLGDRVVLSMRAPCDTCFHCTTGQPVLCEETSGPPGSGEARLWRDGQPVTRGFQLAAFAEYAVVSLRGMARIPDALPSLQASVVGCAVQTGVGSVENVARCEPGSKACVIGLGGVGLAMIMALKAAGASVIAGIDPVAERRERALALGATMALASDDDQRIDTLMALTAGRGFDAVFDNVAATATTREGLQLTRSGGQLVLVGVTGVPQAPGFSTMDLVLRQKKVAGAFLGNCHTGRDLPRFMDSACAGELNLAALVTATVPFERINDGLELMRRGEGVRTVITF
jgi:Zn-dependent alcohol dehydrogenase